MCAAGPTPRFTSQSRDLGLSWVCLGELGITRCSEDYCWGGLELERWKWPFGPGFSLFGTVRLGCTAPNDRGAQRVYTGGSQRLDGC